MKEPLSCLPFVNMQITTMLHLVLTLSLWKPLMSMKITQSINGGCITDQSACMMEPVAVAPTAVSPYDLFVPNPSPATTVGKKLFTAAAVYVA